jgi:hypothetical protein
LYNVRPSSEAPIEVRPSSEAPYLNKTFIYPEPLESSVVCSHMIVLVVLILGISGVLYNVRPSSEAPYLKKTFRRHEYSKFSVICAPMIVLVVLSLGISNASNIVQGFNNDDKK